MLFIGILSVEIHLGMLSGFNIVIEVIDSLITKNFTEKIYLHICSSYTSLSVSFFKHYKQDKTI